MTPEQRRARGVRARALLESEDFNAACMDVYSELQNAVFRTQPRDADKREAAYNEHRGLAAVIQRLKSWRDDGVMAEQEIERDKRR